VKHLCIQQGALQTFLHSAQFGQAYVCYKSREDAIRAQKSLNALVFGNTAIIADFVSDAEVSRLQELSGANPPGSAPPTSSAGAHWSQQPMHSGPRPAFGGPKFDQASPINGAANLSGAGGSMWGSGGTGGGGLWGPIEEHPDNHMLPGGLLGGH
jgi:trinucleotide repeat-containing gene 6 protein